MAKQRQILLMDGDPIFRNHFQKMLKNDFEIETSTNPDGMWDKIKYNPDYALVLVDLTPDDQTTGQKLILIAELNRKYPLLPIAAISKDDTSTTVLSALRQGAKTFIYKHNNSVTYWLTELLRVQRKQVKIVAENPGEKKCTLLLVDDDTRFHTDFKMAFKNKYDIEYVLTAEKMWEVLEEKSDSIDLIALDLMLDGKDPATGLNLIPVLREKYAPIPVIAITADDKIMTVVKAMKLGAKGFLPKIDIDLAYWDSQFGEAIKNSDAQEIIEGKDEKINQLEKGDRANTYPFVGRAPRILEIRDLLERLSQKTNITVLLTGETGVGKEVAARYLHSCSKRRDKPFFSVNLSAIPKSLIESELFGSVKGAFTDSKIDRMGYFRQANGGILMLDEFAEIDHEIQIKLLRFLQERTIRPVGSDTDIEVDVQIILATNKNLEEEVRKGTFRDDLRYRVNFTLEIPTLKERAEDIIPILDYYLLHKYETTIAQSLESEVIRRVLDYDWPGNIRQLCNTIDGMMLWRDLRGKEKVDIPCFEEGLKSGSSGLGAPPPKKSPVMSIPVEGIMVGSLIGRKKEKAIKDMKEIEGMLSQNGVNKSDVAESLQYKGTDHMRARIRTCYNNFPDIFGQFPRIREKFSL